MSFAATLSLAALALALLPLSPSHAVAAAAMEELAVIAHRGIPHSQLSKSELEAIFTLSRREWPNGQRVVPFNHPPETPTRVAFDEAVLGMDPSRVARFWVDRRIRGQGTSPRTTPSSALLLKVVAKLPGSISYVPASMTSPAVKVVARVRDGKVVAP